MNAAVMKPRPKIRIDHLQVSEAEVWMLAMAKGAAAPLSCVIRGLPRWVVEEHTQVGEVVRIQMLLLFAEWRELSSCGRDRRRASR